MWGRLINVAMTAADKVRDVEGNPASGKSKKAMVMDAILQGSLAFIGVKQREEMRGINPADLDTEEKIQAVSDYIDTEAARNKAVKKLLGLGIQIALLLMLSSSSAFAQATAPTSWVATVYRVGVTAPVATKTITRAEATCGLPGTTAPTPRTILWDDPFTAGLRCRWTDPSTGPFLDLSASNYEMTLTAVDAGGVSAVGPRVPFTSRSAPNAPTGLIVTP